MAEGDTWAQARSSVLFCLEPSDHAHPSEYRTELSGQVDRVPAILDSVTGQLTWVDRSRLELWGVPLDQVETEALGNLASAAASSFVEWKQIHDVRVGYFNTSLPFESALLLAPGLRSIVASVIGWPIYAVVPHRDFVYIWAAEHAWFTERLAAVVRREYTAAKCPLSTEIFEIDDEGMRAVGVFQDPEPA